MKKEYNLKFAADYYRMTGNVKKFNVNTFINNLFSHRINFMKWWRKNKEKSTLLRKIILKRYALKYGLEISADANIGKGLYLGHAFNITVASGSIIGENCNLHKGCTVGRENRGKRKGVPVIGNCVSIGINSTVIGKISVGNDVIIAPNSFVNFDVPSHSIVIGNPGVIHSRDNATEGYVEFRV